MAAAVLPVLAAAPALADTAPVVGAIGSLEGATRVAGDPFVCDGFSLCLWRGTGLRGSPADTATEADVAKP